MTPQPGELSSANHKRSMRSAIRAFAKRIPGARKAVIAIRSWRQRISEIRASAKRIPGARKAVIAIRSFWQRISENHVANENRELVSKINDLVSNINELVAINNKVRTEMEVMDKERIKKWAETARRLFECEQERLSLQRQLTAPPVITDAGCSVSSQIHPTARISPLADLEESSRGSRLIIHENVTIDSYVKVKFSGGIGDVEIGARSYIDSGTVIYSGHGVKCGEYVLIAANCTLAASNYETSDPNRPIRDQGVSERKGGIVIEDDVWIGANSVLLDGTHIGRGAIVGAGSLVRGSIPPMTYVAGNPVRLLGYRDGKGNSLKSSLDSRP